MASPLVYIALVSAEIVGISAVSALGGIAFSGGAMLGSGTEPRHSIR